MQANWFASLFALSQQCYITCFAHFFFAALPSVVRRVNCPMEATSCHQTLTPHWRPTKPAVSPHTVELLTDFHQTVMAGRVLSGPEGQSCWIRLPSASNPINLQAGLFRGGTLSSHLNIYGQPGAVCQQTLPHSSRLPPPFIRCLGLPSLFIPSLSSYL